MFFKNIFNWRGLLCPLTVCDVAVAVALKDGRQHVQVWRTGYVFGLRAYQRSVAHEYRGRE